MKFSRTIVLSVMLLINCSHHSPHPGPAKTADELTSKERNDDPHAVGASDIGPAAAKPLELRRIMANQVLARDSGKGFRLPI